MAKPLDSDLRDRLASIIGREDSTTGARMVAERAAAAAIETLAVGLREPFEHMTPVQRLLRNQLRARARELGDARTRNGEHSVRHLIEQCAYEHWHRMLFARFLAENNLLIHPELKVAVSLEECREVAKEEGLGDEWELAGRYASKMLPQVFRPDDPVLAVRFAPEHQKELIERLAKIPDEVFTSSDGLGWVYQFWQAHTKGKVNESGDKIGADQLPAVTQLFTEAYMVDFLLQNTLGAWWVGAGRTLPDGLTMPFLRFRDDGTPAAGTFGDWPKTASKLHVLDPCCGSGHFLVAAFDLLVRFRLAEGLAARDACDAVLRENLYGLELDERCTQIAAFALALAAWTFPEAGGYRPLPPFNVACSGRSVALLEQPDETDEEKERRVEENARRKARWESLGGADERKRNGMGRLFDLFREAPLLGSLIDPTKDDAEGLLYARADELRPLLEKAMGEMRSVDEDERESIVTARGIADAARILSARYHLVCTNVPFLYRQRQSAILQKYLEKEFKVARGDLATAFLDRAVLLCEAPGVSAIVLPQYWMFLKTYTAFRKALLRARTWHAAVRLGPRSFRTITGEVVNVALVIIGAAPPSVDQPFVIIDANEALSPPEKSDVLREGKLYWATQAEQISNPDSRIMQGSSQGKTLLAQYADSYLGQRTGDSLRFIRKFWEIPLVSDEWERLGSTVKTTMLDGGNEDILLWEHGKGELYRFQMELKETAYASGGWKQGWQAWEKPGVRVKLMGLAATLHRNGHFDSNCAVVLPKDPAHLPAVWAFCSSEEFIARVRMLDQKKNVMNGTLVKVPFDLAEWEDIASKRYPNGLPTPVSLDPTQWFFKGRIATSTAPLQVVVARLLGYCWPEQEADALTPLVDDDGIMCVPTVRGEKSASERIVDGLAAAYGSEWSPEKLSELLSSAAGRGRSLDWWIRTKFFEQHCTIFQNRPFIWQVWDGHREGFSALINYHRFDRKALESLTYTYLGEWVSRQQESAKRGEAGAGDRLEHALAFQKKLVSILEGEDPFDLFIRWKSLKDQPIGWEPDLRDGVRVNIRPFAIAGVLAINPKKLNITWEVDDGQDPPSAPWGPVRNSGLHTKIDQRRRAREDAARTDHQDITTASIGADPSAVSGKLRTLTLHDVGPLRTAELEFATRLNIFTGDNGLGKTFLLDVIWWAITGTWSLDMALPRMPRDRRETVDPSIAYSLGDETLHREAIATIDPATMQWTRSSVWPIEADVVLYARVDGSIALYDGLRHLHPERPPASTLDDAERLPVSIFTASQLWEGVRSENGGATLLPGLRADWNAWQTSQPELFERFKDVLKMLSAEELDPLQPGDPIEKFRLNDPFPMPTLEMSYGPVALVHASAGIRRIVTLAYVLTWAWYEHCKAATYLRRKPGRNVVFLFDEVEAHLHPKWQRVVLPALLDVIEGLAKDTDGAVRAQLFAATHAPLVLASLETRFNTEYDRVFHLGTNAGNVTIKEFQWYRGGDVTAWLETVIFGLKDGRSIESERALEAAESLMLLNLEGPPADLNDQHPVHQALLRTLPGDDPFWARWLPWKEQRSLLEEKSNVSRQKPDQ